MERDQTTVTQETTHQTACWEVLFIMFLAIGEDKRRSYLQVRHFFDVIFGLLSDAPALADRLARKGTLAISESQQGFQIYALTPQGLINTWSLDSDAIRKAFELRVSRVQPPCRFIQMFDERWKSERGPVSQ